MYGSAAPKWPKDNAAVKQVLYEAEDVTCSPVFRSVVQGKLTSQGKLLQQETFCVWEQDGGVLSRSKERRVFLFEQIIIFSELLRKGSSNPGYQFKNSIKVGLVCTGSGCGSL